jgi:hypothetical protein
VARKDLAVAADCVKALFEREEPKEGEPDRAWIGAAILADRR